MRWNALFLCLVVHLSVTAQKAPFRWTRDHGAMLVPVQVDGYPGKNYMQLDLGSPQTLLYKNKLPGVTDTLRNHSLLIHQMRFTPKTIPVVEAGNSRDRIIGTLGADWISNKVVIFDYPRKRLILSDTMLPKYQATLYPFHFIAGRILLPAEIMGRSTILYFDTGSSAYSLITDSTTARALAKDGTVPDEMPVNSWGNTLTAHSLPSAHSLKMAGRHLALHRVTWISGVRKAQVQQMKQLGIGGMTGNVLFLKHILILDTRNQRFGIL